jgi:hypothetical protein
MTKVWSLSAPPRKGEKMGYSKGTRWKRAFQSQDGELVDRVWAHLRAHRVLVQETAHPIGMYKHAPREYWLMVPLEDYPMALACIGEFQRP